jgi:5'-3' exonuclease
VIFDYLECSIHHDEIPSQPAKFSALLEEISGKAAKVIGRAAIRRLYAKLGWEFYEIHGFEAVDYIEAAKTRLRRETDQQATRAVIQKFD